MIDDSHPVTTSDNVSGSPNAALAVNYIRKVILDSGQLSASGVTNVNQFTLTGITALAANTYDTDNGQDHSRMPVTGVNNCVDKIKATGNFTVRLSAELGSTALTVTNVTLDMRYLNGDVDDTTYQAFASTSLGLLLVEPVYSGETLTGFNISQRRYGHGCGLSQRGAQARADAGQMYYTILGFYYPRSSLSTLSISKPTQTTINVTSSTNAMVINASNYLNVRSGPSTSYSKVGCLPAGARIHVTQLGIAGEWCSIVYGGQTAYVHIGLCTAGFKQLYNHCNGE